MKLRDDIDPSKTWIISDTHFGHRNISEFANRPEDWRSLIIERWAANVGNDDTLLHLGDLCYRGNAEFRELVAPHLTGGRKLLILGNHDRQRASFYRRAGFKIVRPFAIYYGGRRVSFSHYPWNKDEDGPQSPSDLRIHGHIHTSGYTRTAYVPYLKDHINVSIEHTNYQPVNLGLLLAAAVDGSVPQSDVNVTPTEVEKEYPHG